MVDDETIPPTTTPNSSPVTRVRFPGHFHEKQRRKFRSMNARDKGRYRKEQRRRERLANARKQALLDARQAMYWQEKIDTHTAFCRACENRKRHRWAGSHCDGIAPTVNNLRKLEAASA